MEKASVGRIVHFVGQGSKRGEVCRAAIVIAIKDDQVSLGVFNPQMLTFKNNVKFNAEEKKPGTWHFPERVDETAPVGDQLGDQA
jgi:hypothetical protein